MIEILNNNPEIHFLKSGKLLSAKIDLREEVSLEGSWVELKNGSKVCLTPFEEVGSLITDYNILIFNKDRILFETKTKIKPRGLLFIDKYTYMVTEAIKGRGNELSQYEAIPYCINEYPQKKPTQLIYFYK